MTEIQWLVDIMLNNKLSEPVKQKFIARIGEVEAKLTPSRPAPFGHPGLVNPVIGPSAQSPSTQAALARQQAEGIEPFVGSNSPVAQTLGAAQALNARQQAIAIAASGAPEKGRTSPRKF